MTPEQIRGARAMVGWGVRVLAERAGVTPNTISRIENGGDAKASTLTAIRQALEAAGITFLPDDGNGFGVRKRRSEGTGEPG